MRGGTNDAPLVILEVEYNGVVIREGSVGVARRGMRDGGVGRVILGIRGRGDSVAGGCRSIVGSDVGMEGVVMCGVVDVGEAPVGGMTGGPSSFSSPASSEGEGLRFSRTLRGVAISAVIASSMVITA